MNDMILRLKRIHHEDDYTLSMLYINEVFFCFVLEDEKRVVKVKGETRIWNGVYDLRLKEVLTPLTKKYRKKYPWFEWFVEIIGIPQFTYVYFHVGNFEKNTDGCPLLGYTADIDPQLNGFVGKSAKAFQAFQEIVANHLGNGGRATLIVE